MKIGIAGPIETQSFKRYLNASDNALPMGVGGASINHLVPGLLKFGHKVVIYTLEQNLKEPVVVEGNNLRIYFGNYRVPARYRMKDFFSSESGQIADFIEQDPPDIVHAHWSYEYAIGAIKTGVPHLITIRDSPLKILILRKDIYRLIRLLMHLWVVRNGKHFSAVSPYVSEQKMMPKFEKIIGNTITDDFQTDSAKILHRNKIRIISCLNGWGRIKNPIPALRAFAALKKKFNNQIEYHLYGPDYEADGKAEHWASKTGFCDGVHFHGQIPHTDLINVLPTFDILLHPALEESFGNTLIEGMAAGLPVIAGKYSGAVPWVLADGRCGMLVDVRSPVEIEEAVDKLISDPILYHQLSERGLENVHSRFSAENIAEQYISLYKEIVKKSNVQS